MNLENKNDRLLYGIEAEKAVRDYLVDAGFSVIHNSVSAEQGTAEFKNEVVSNLVRGDVEILDSKNASIFRLDVKRGTFISKRSFDKFSGQFYILFPGGDLSDVGAARVLWRRTVLHYANDATKGFTENTEEMYSGDIGYRLKKRLRLETTFSDFRQRLVKAMLIYPEVFSCGKIDDMKAFYQLFFFGEIEEPSEDVSF
jgi:hypothetical protein